MFFEIADKEARINELQGQYNHLCALYDECYEIGNDVEGLEVRLDIVEAQIAETEAEIAEIEAEYVDADSLYWETAEARGWV